MKKFLVKVTRLGATASLLTSGAAFAQLSTGVGDAGAANTGPSSVPEVVTNVINILLYIVGAASVIMLIVGGIRYIMSQGDQAAISAAKNTILYAIIGVIVAIIAYAVVNWVINDIFGAS